LHLVGEGGIQELHSKSLVVEFNGSEQMMSCNKSVFLDGLNDYQRRGKGTNYNPGTCVCSVDLNINKRMCSRRDRFYAFNTRRNLKFAFTCTRYWWAAWCHLIYV